MRVSPLILALGLTAIPAVLAAQQAQPPPAAPPVAPTSTTSASGWVDGGVRTTDLSGDAARYERYRDMGDGVVVDFFRSQFQRNNWFIDANADHVGRLDQRYQGFVVRPGLFKGWVSYDQIPMLMSRTTQTIYTNDAPNVFRIDNATQQLLQNTPSTQQSAVMNTVV